MTFEDSIRVLLQGTCGVNPNLLAGELGIARATVAKFVAGGVCRPDIVDAIGLFVFRRMNAHLLIGPEDLVPPVTQGVRPQC